MVTYTKFDSMLNEQIGNYNSEDDIYKLLVTIVKNPNRYTGIFRVTNAKTKIIQNVTQSQEIKFGDFMEKIITVYIAEMGYTNMNKTISTDGSCELLNADQIFSKGSKIYLIEQKIRDDHDSTKKRGQFTNFEKKVQTLKKQYSGHKIVAIMWFIDDNHKKNQKFYEEKIKSINIDDVEVYIKYGRTLFSEIFKKTEIWDEINEHLRKLKNERSNELLTIPDFATSPKIKRALKRLEQEEPKLYKKLMSDQPFYIDLRNELFPFLNDTVY